MISTWPPKLPQNPPIAAPGFTRLEDDQPLAAAEGVRGTGHGLDRDAAPPSSAVRDRVRRVDHQILVDRFHPERDTAFTNLVPDTDGLLRVHLQAPGGDPRVTLWMEPEAI